MNKRIEKLFQKYLSDVASEQEKRELNNWIASNKELQSWLEAQLYDSADSMNEEQQKRMLENIHRVIDKQESKTFILPSWVKSAAAVILVLITAGSLFFALTNRDNTPTLYSKVEAMRGQKSSITLPDGTSVILNSESSIMYGTDYNNSNRTVELQGEAYFDVKQNQTLPFTVKAGDLSITAKGTAFNVRAYLDENYISTTLTEGKVEIKTPNETMHMLPNERVEYNSQNKTASTIKLENAILSVGWLNDQLSFESATLAEVANNLSRAYNIVIEFSSESIKEQRYTGRIDNNSLHSVLRILSLTSPVEYKIIGDKVILYELPDEIKFFSTKKK
ncbi:MAG TPA: DUF4974 domain-containing protein [Paludibacter sp.]|jgi:ferric-dicitrate binding protein FerR (iron transport regulator)|nr:MAG: fec operon regulator FecR [Bacteroidetes bacterium ADurb.Bin174]HQB27544.1 DUF4974 domain-containing protein [Paludibacter sp.]